MNLLGVLSISASGMEAQSTRARYLVENIANAETTRTPEGGPYRRRDVVFQAQPLEEDSKSFHSVFQDLLAEPLMAVRVDQVVVDQRPPILKYMPGHPDADPNGYVAFPRVNPVEDMVDLLSALHSYEANVAAVRAVREMILRSIDLLR